MAGFRQSGARGGRPSLNRRPANQGKAPGRPRPGRTTFRGAAANPGKASLTGARRPGLGAPAQARSGANPDPAPYVVRRAQPDSLYNREIDLANRQEEHRLSELGDTERTIRHEFGIDDPTNPFSRANGLKQTFLARQKAATANMASRGQLYSGAHDRAISRTRREEEEARAALRQAFDQAISQVGSAKAGVKFETEEQRNAAFEDWLARAPEAEVPVASDAEPSAPVAPAPRGGPAGPPPPAPRTVPLNGKQVSVGQQLGATPGREDKGRQVVDPFAKKKAATKKPARGKAKGKQQVYRASKTKQTKARLGGPAARPRGR